MGVGWGRLGDGWVPYGLPQLPLIVQLALQAARALLRGVRLLLQAPDLPAHRLQRAAPRHGAGRRRAGCGAEAGCCARAASAALPNAGRPAQASQRDGGAPCGPGPARKSRSPGQRRRTAGGCASAGGGHGGRGGARRGPREFANRGRRCACSLRRGWQARGRAPGHLEDWVGRAGKEATARGILLRFPAPLPGSASCGATGLAAKGDGAAYWQGALRSGPRIPRPRRN